MTSLPYIFWLINASGVIGGMLAVWWLVTGRRNQLILYAAFALSMLFFIVRFGSILFL